MENQTTESTSPIDSNNQKETSDKRNRNNDVEQQQKNKSDSSSNSSPSSSSSSSSSDNEVDETSFHDADDKKLIEPNPDVIAAPPSKPPLPPKPPSLQSANNVEDKQPVKVSEKESPNEEFIEKLTSHVQAYINECFEMESIPVTEKPAPQTLQSSEKDNEKQTEPSSLPPPTVAVINLEDVKQIDPPKSSSNKMMPLPSIHITNEYGQESIDMDNANSIQQQSQEVNQQQNKPKISIVMKNVSFGYSRKVKVLSDINLNIPKAQIFALLGSSGCGKTTLLKIILGRLTPKKGDVRVFGNVPGSRASNIPGSGVGFMPQELALFPYFTIEETLYYIGLIHRIPKDEIQKRTDFMIELLNLPPKERKIEQCSGGQQRRASIALTLFHSPPLLILDEPTVGVDPLLRLKIWQYLEYLCINNRMTIIITTHYIEESRRANTVAFMRFGRILTQDSPDNLLAKYNTNILEDVFLILCQHDCGDIKQKHSTKKKDKNSQKKAQELVEVEEETSKRSKFRNFTVDPIRMKALFFKNIVGVKRNPLLFFFFLLLPVIQILLFCFSCYKSPDNIAVSIHNGDGKGLSKRFESFIDPLLIRSKHYPSKEEAIQTVIDGKAWTAIVMEKNFSAAYRRRAKNPSDLDEEDYESSKIKLYTDQTDSFIFNVLDHSLMYSYQVFVEDVAASFGYNPATVRIPIETKEAIYGKLNLHDGYKLLDGLISGALIAIIYTTPLIMSGMVIVVERKDQVIERTFVNGATSLEVFLSHLVTLSLSLILQVIILMFVVLCLFEITMHCSLWEAFIILYLQGITGILIGLLISTISHNEVVALLLSLGLVFPVWMVSGVFWPLESVDPWLQNIFWKMPLSTPIRACVYLFKRGWSYDHYDVLLGYLSSMFYNTTFLVANILLFHFTSH